MTTIPPGMPAAPPSPHPLATKYVRRTVSPDDVGTTGKVAVADLTKIEKGPVERLSQAELEAAAAKAAKFDQIRRVASYRTALSNGTASPEIAAYIARLEERSSLMKVSV